VLYTCVLQVRRNAAQQVPRVFAFVLIEDLDVRTLLDGLGGWSWLRALVKLGQCLYNWLTSANKKLVGLKSRPSTASFPMRPVKIVLAVASFLNIYASFNI